MNKNVLPGDLEEDVYQKEKPEYEESIEKHYLQNKCLVDY